MSFEHLFFFVFSVFKMVIIALGPSDKKEVSINKVKRPKFYLIFYLILFRERLTYSKQAHKHSTKCHPVTNRWYIP